MARWSRPIRAAPPTGRRPRFSPQTGLFYVGASRAFSVYYIFDPDRNPQGWGRPDRGGANLGSSIEAIDYKTGKIRWTHKWETPGGTQFGLMSTAGNLVFTGDGSSNLVALNATTGDPLWHAKLRRPVAMDRSPTNSTDIQYVVVGAGDTLWAFAMKK